jgi:hypothetical protein
VSGTPDYSTNSDSYQPLTQSFLYNRHFRVSCDDAFSEYHIISAGVPQGSILAPTLYNIYTSDIPHNINTTFGTFADDTGIIASDTNPETASFLLQTHLNQIPKVVSKVEN